MSKLEEQLAFHMKSIGMPTPVREHKFSRDVVGNEPGIRERLKKAGLKDWRFDFCWPELKFAVEVEGGSFTGGRHTRGTGFEEDCLKYGAAMTLGWTVYRCSGGLIKSGKAIEQIEQIYRLVRAKV